MKDKIIGAEKAFAKKGVDLNFNRNIIVDKLIDVARQAAAKHKIYRKAMGEFQELQRQRNDLIKQLAGITGGEDEE